MSTSELIAQQILNGNINKRTWGGILYNVKVYGAIGDGIHDDTITIQSAIDAAIAEGGKAVFFPHGTYKVTALSGLSSVVLFGDNASFVGISTTISQMGSPSSTVSVKDFGAKGDGVNDDTAAFQTAFDSFGIKGGVLFVPVGHYKITDTLVIDTPISIIGAGYSWSDGTTYLDVKMDGKPIGNPAIKIHTTQSVHIEGLYVANNGVELRDGIAIDGSNNGAYDQMAGFITIERMIVYGFKFNFLVRHSWFISFKDVYARGGTFGWYVNGGTITTTYFDHCYASDNTSRGFYINGAYYSTLIACASDAQPIGYKFSNAENVTMFGCASEGTLDTAIDIDNSTVVIEGFTSVGSGARNDNNFATLLNAAGSFVSARGFSEITLASGNVKTNSIALDANTRGEYISSGRELLGLVYPKNGKFLFNGQAYTTGLPTATAWLASDIGKIVHESEPVEAGTTPNKYIKLGYVRKTAGNGNVLNTDWYEVRTLTGN